MMNSEELKARKEELLKQKERIEADLARLARELNRRQLIAEILARTDEPPNTYR